MVDAVAGVGTNGAAQALSGDSITANALDKDAFLKLLVAQLKNQDPLKPQENAEFVAELAQFSSLEQTMGINERLDMLNLQSTGLSNSQVVNMVGKTATVRGSAITFNGTGATTGSFELEGKADSVKVQIRGGDGRLVKTIDMGAENAGTVSFNWNGRNDNELLQPAGNYSVTVEALDADGGRVPVSQKSTALIESVSFEQGFPELILANGVKASVADILRVEKNSI